MTIDRELLNRLNRTELRMYFELEVKSGNRDVFLVILREFASYGDDVRLEHIHHFRAMALGEDADLLKSALRNEVLEGVEWVIHDTLCNWIRFEGQLDFLADALSDKETRRDFLVSAFIGVQEIWRYSGLPEESSDLVRLCAKRIVGSDEVGLKFQEFAHPKFVEILSDSDPR